MDTFTELFGHSPLVWAILAAEAAFWVLLFGGLAVRYIARRKRLGGIILLGVPLVDVALLVLTAIDLAGGVRPNFSHVLAAIYLGFTIAFGHSLIGSVDVWFAHRFAGGPARVTPPKSGPVAVRRAWAEWRRLFFAWLIAVPVLLLMHAISGWSVPASWGEFTDGDLIWAMVFRLTVLLGIWLVAGPLFTVIFRSAPGESPRNGVTSH